jgi:hypothetical protein
MVEPDTSKIERHSKAKSIVLGEDIANRRKVYLDIRFWIFARDAMLDVSTNTASRKLLHYLRRGIANNSFLCPISASTFLEMMKQPLTLDRRIATAKLIDELSLGVTIKPPHIVIGTEIRRWLLLLKGVQNIHSMQELIWTKVSYVLGDAYPNWPGLALSSAQEFELQRSVFDLMWDMPLTKVVETTGTSELSSNDYSELSAETNKQNKVWAHELTSLKVAYDIEIRGGIEAVSEVAAQSLMEVVAEADGWPMSSSAADKSARENGVRNLLYEGFTKGDAKDHIRSLHVDASIHAAMRRDKQRQFEPNDYYDIQHATAALSYFDALFTEKRLRDLVSRADLGLEAVNGCQAFSDVGQATEYLKSIS